MFNKIAQARQALGKWGRVYSSACLTIMLRTHVKRWQKVANSGTPPWDERNQIIASFITAHSSVLDIGCGPQTLRSHLPAECKYQPCDIIKSSPDVIFCDFNSGVYPDVSETYDYVVCSGVFEYIRKPKEFLAKVPLFGRTMLMSYNPLISGQSKISRLGNNWINHFTRAELEQLFREAGLKWVLLHTDKIPYLLYRIHTSPKEGSVVR